MINRSNIVKLLQQGVNAVFGLAYAEIPEEWPMVFDMSNSAKAFEEDVLATGFGAAVVKEEGSDFTFDEARTAWAARYTHNTIGLGFIVTEEAIEDDLYNVVVPKYGKAIARSFRQTKEIYAASVLNNGFTTFLTGDGVALFSTAHPTVGAGNFANMLATPADLSETSLEDMLILIRKCKDDRGIPIALRPLRLIIPPDEEYNAIRLTKSDQRTGTADNDINAIKAKGIFRTDPAVLTRLTDPDAWFIKTDAPEGAKLFQRVALGKIKVVEDPTSGNVINRGRERYSVGVTDARSLFASAGAG